MGNWRFLPHKNNDNNNNVFICNRIVHNRPMIIISAMDDVSDKWRDVENKWTLDFLVYLLSFVFYVSRDLGL